MTLTLRFISIVSILISTSVMAVNDSKLLVSAMLGDTPIINDLKQLTDEIGSRMTGTIANEKSVEWGLNKFKQAGVFAQQETFEMPRSWIEIGAKAKIFGDAIEFTPSIAAMPFTRKTTNKGETGALVYLQKGNALDFANAQNLEKKWLLIKTDILDDQAGIHGLFQEYVDAIGIEERAMKVGALGIVYMSSRPKNLMYRHLPSQGAKNELPIVVMERESALKTARLLALGKNLNLNVKLEIGSEKPYQSSNVIAEIKGSSVPEEFVVFGAHLDSFDMGTGALDNGANVSMVIDIARQITRLGIKPKRTIRFALYNGEEQGIYGSHAYTVKHAHELNNHIMTATIDIGTGQINGFFINGRTEFTPALEQVLLPVSGLGPFTTIIDPVVGTDNYDFMMQGVPNIVAIQSDANYASNYHAQSDTFDKVDQKQLKLNSAIMASVVLGFANLEQVTWQRQTSEQIVNMVEHYKMETAMKTFGLWDSWQNNQRGIKH